MDYKHTKIKLGDELSIEQLLKQDDEEKKADNQEQPEGKLEEDKGKDGAKADEIDAEGKEQAEQKQPKRTRIRNYFKVRQMNKQVAYDVSQKNLCLRLRDAFSKIDSDGKSLPSLVLLSYALFTLFENDAVKQEQILERLRLLIKHVFSKETGSLLRLED